MTESHVSEPATFERTSGITLAALALVLSPLLAAAAMAMFPDPSDEVAMVQTGQWLGVWTLGLGASLLFAVGSSLIFGARIGAGSDRTVRFGTLFAWVTVLLTAIMFALNVTAARMLVDPTSAAVLPAGQQQVGLDIIEATTTGLYVFTVAFAAGAALLFGRAMARSSTTSSRVGTVGQVLGVVSLVAMAAVLLVPEAVGFDLGFLLTFLLGLAVYAWGFVVGVSVFRGRTVPETTGETA